MHVCCSPVLSSSVFAPSCLQIEYQHLRWSGGGGRQGWTTGRKRNEREGEEGREREAGREEGQKWEMGGRE